MILPYSKNYRIKTDRNYDRSVPQWKGLLFWHNFTVITPELTAGGRMHYRTVTTKAAFNTANDACMFLRIAAVQEFNGGSRGTVNDEDPNFPRLSDE